MLGFTIEGVSGSGKTQLLKKVHARLHAEFPGNSKYFLSEHYTERVLEHLRERGALTEAVVFRHIDSIVASLARFDVLKKGSKFRSKGGNSTLLVTMERFLLGHVSNLRGSDGNKFGTRHSGAIRRTYENLADLGLRNVILRVPEDQLEERILSTLRHRNEQWRSHLNSIGAPREIVRRYRRWQELLLDCAGSFGKQVNPIFIDIESRDYDKYADIVYERIFKGRSGPTE